jgi:hypothetical protein
MSSAIEQNSGWSDVLVKEFFIACCEQRNRDTGN